MQRRAVRRGLARGQEGVPEILGDRYELIERVGDGGMATVYRAVDLQLRRDVAIKVMHPHLAARLDARNRFSREAQNIARLKHPNIVDVYDFSVSSDETSFIVTEFVHGETVSAYTAAHGPFMPQAAALIGHAIAGALVHAHAAGIVHRDIKPDNLMVSRDGQIKLMDFGIATAVDMEGMTATGAIVGSPAHMAPEQIEGEELDHRCDIFALGIILYFLATRRLPFAAANAHALFRQILEGQFELPSRHNPQVDRQFEAIVLQCMARHRADRYSSALDLQAALQAYLRQFRISDVATLLPRFLQQPEVFQYDLKPGVVKYWTDEGTRLAAAGQLALAIDAFNRALAVDPDADGPKKALSNLTSRSRRRKRLVRVGWLVAGGLLVAGLAAAVHRSSQHQRSLDQVGEGRGALADGAPTPVPGRAPHWQAPPPANPAGPLAPLGEPPQDLANVPTPTVAIDGPMAVQGKPDAPAQGQRPVRKAAVLDLRTVGKTPVAEGTLTSMQQPEPLEVVTVDVVLSCVPPSAHLMFRGRDYPGVAMLKLEPGSYSFECQFQVSCKECSPLRVPFSISRKDAAAGAPRRFFRGLEADAPRG